VNLDGADRKPRHARDLVRDAVADGRRDLGEVQAVLDDDVEVDRDLVPVAADLDALARTLGQPFRACHRDDAVALACGLPHDVLDRRVRDRDPAELGGRHRVHSGLDDPPTPRVARRTVTIS